jgi:hypothetical protein
MICMNILCRQQTRGFNFEETNHVRLFWILFFNFQFARMRKVILIRFSNHLFWIHNINQWFLQGISLHATEIKSIDIVPNLSLIFSSSHKSDVTQRIVLLIVHSCLVDLLRSKSTRDNRIQYKTIGQTQFWFVISRFGIHWKLWVEEWHGKCFHGYPNSIKSNYSTLLTECWIHSLIYD